MNIDKKLWFDFAHHDKINILQQPALARFTRWFLRRAYIDNVIQANEKALYISTEQVYKGKNEFYNIELDGHKYLLQKKKNRSEADISPSRENIDYFSEVFNIAYGGNTTLQQ